MFRGILIRWLVNAGSLLLISYAIDGIAVDGVGPALIAAAVLGIINAVIRPILLILTLPINLLTLGLFTFIINGALLALTAKVVRGFSVSGFWSAVLGALLLSIISGILSFFIEDVARPDSAH
ncbi:MAG: phage holin family protein [Candidatus Manganitrophaceae bacterium]|nr:MAG: phage holin family protein [Candidatus Manganitrophaceae bacterium]